MLEEKQNNYNSTTRKHENLEPLKQKTMNYVVALHERHNQTKQNKTKQNKTKQNKTKQNKTKQICANNEYKQLSLTSYHTIAAC